MTETSGRARWDGRDAGAQVMASLKDDEKVRALSVMALYANEITGMADARARQEKARKVLQVGNAAEPSPVIGLLGVPPLILLISYTYSTWVCTHHSLG